MNNKTKNLKPLLEIQNKADVKSFEILDTYEDDHLPCAECKINGIEIAFMWYDNLGALYYWKDSDSAFEDLKTYIRNEYDMAVDYEEQYGEED
jgi:hypothetical protein